MIAPTIAPTSRPSWLATNQPRSGTRDMTAVWRPAPPGSSGGLILPGTGRGTIRRRANGRGGGVRVSNPPPPPLRGATSPSREGFEEFQQADFRGRQALAGQGPLQSAERIARVRF